MTSRSLVIAALAISGCIEGAAGQELAERIEEARAAVERCSGDCRFEQTHLLRLEFEEETQDVERLVFALSLAIAMDDPYIGHDSYWVEAFVAALDARPHEASWIRDYWRQEADEAGRLPDDLRADLTAEVRRITGRRRESFQMVSDQYTRLARDFGLDPRLVVRDPFGGPVGAWLARASSPGSRR